MKWVRFNEGEVETTDEAAKTEVKTTKQPRLINNTPALWLRHPSNNTKEDYQQFYRALYPYNEEPLFWIHLNIDHPFELTGILYFPHIKNNIEVRKNNIHLYSNQMFVTDQVENIVPEFLLLLHGVIDSPDIPLNVSRSYLQSDPQVKQINKYITRKVADKLEEVFKNDRPQFEKIWNDIGLLIKYGMLTDEKFFERAEKFCLFETLDGNFFTHTELKERVANQTDKNNKTVWIYTTDPVEQHAYIEAAKAKGYEVLQLTQPIDAHFIQSLEYKLSDVTFKRVDADTPDRLIEKDETLESVLSKDEEAKLSEWFNEVLNFSHHPTIRVETLVADRCAGDDYPSRVVAADEGNVAHGRWHGLYARYARVV